MQRNEVHLCDFPNGHTLSTDCWCEPKNIYWVTNKHGIEVLVVEHSDNTPMHHLDVLGDRHDHTRDAYTCNEPDAPWITRALNRVGERPLLPPGESL